MNRILLGAVASLLFAVTPSFSQTNAPTDAPGPKIWDASKQAWVKWDSTQHTTGPAIGESLTPDKGDWTVSAGMAYVDDTVELPGLSAKATGSAYGGYLAVESFLTKALSLRTELLIFGKSETVNGVSASATEFALDTGLKFYPLQLTKASDFRLQPYLRGAIGPVFYDLSASGASASADPTLFGAAGGGFDIVLDQAWSITAEADYYTTLIDSTLTVDGTSTTFREHGFLAEAGFRYHF